MAMPTTIERRIAMRVKAMREKANLSQEEVSRHLGIRDRQTLAAVEAGERRLAPAELAQAADLFGVGIDYFTDAFRLEGEGAFTFRASGVAIDVLDGFEAKAGRWIATYRELAAREGVPATRLATKLDLTPRSSFEDAESAADEVRRAWKLGKAPAMNLEAAIRRNLNTLVLNVDAPPGLSGAGSRIPGLGVILINRHEPAGRRNFDLAHELFHLLTWDSMEPDRIEPEEPAARKGKRHEQMANKFAAALLMPGDVLAKTWTTRGRADVHDWLNATATSLRVSASALKWRMINLGLPDRRTLTALDDTRLVANGNPSPHERPGPLFCADFVGRVHGAVESGRLSLRRAASLLSLSLADFADLCKEYGLALSYDL